MLRKTLPGPLTPRPGGRGSCCFGSSPSRASRVRFTTRPKSRTMRATRRQLGCQCLRSALKFEPQTARLRQRACASSQFNGRVAKNGRHGSKTVSLSILHCGVSGSPGNQADQDDGQKLPDRSTRNSASWGPGRRLPVALSGSPEGWRAYIRAAALLLTTSTAAARRPPLASAAACQRGEAACPRRRATATSIALAACHWQCACVFLHTRRDGGRGRP